MSRDWKKLTALTQNKGMIVTRVYLPEDEISLEGEFELPPLAQLSSEDQVFVAAFVKTHGSIKAMEKLFGVSYPTIKSRLNSIAQRFDFLNVTIEEENESVAVLDQLAAGKISVEEALRELKK